MICLLLPYFAPFNYHLLVTQSRLACVLIFSFIGRVSPALAQSLLVLSSPTPVLRVIQGMIHVLLPLASLASPDERPRLRQIR